MLIDQTIAYRGLDRVYCCNNSKAKYYSSDQTYYKTIVQYK